MGDHDALFKHTFAVSEHAAGEIRSMLPAALVGELDLEGLTLVHGSFVDDALAERHADLLFCTRLRSGDTAYVYFLLEHQSEPDPLMPWRLLVYQVRIWQRHLREVPNAKRLPVIVPIVVHHAEQGWTAPVRFHELFEGLDRLPFLRAIVPDFALVIDDLIRRSDAELKSRPLASAAKLTLWVLRDARSEGRLAEHAVAWVDDLRHVGGASQRETLRALVRYMLKVAGRAALDGVRSVLAREAPETETTMITAAESYRLEGLEQGKQEGLEQGKQEGLAEGRLAGKREMVKRLLEAKFAVLTEEVCATIDGASEQALDGMVVRAVSAGSIDEALAG